MRREGPPIAKKEGGEREKRKRMDVSTRGDRGPWGRWWRGSGER